MIVFVYLAYLVFCLDFFLGLIWITRLLIKIGSGSGPEASSFPSKPMRRGEYIAFSSLVILVYGKSLLYFVGPIHKTSNGIEWVNLENWKTIYSSSSFSSFQFIFFTICSSVAYALLMQFSSLRLRNTNLPSVSQWLILLPPVNLILMLLLCIVPSKTEEGSTWKSYLPRTYIGSQIATLVLSVSIICYLAYHTDLTEVLIWLLLVLPFMQGFLSPLLFDYKVHMRFSVCIDVSFS